MVMMKFFGNVGEIDVSRYGTGVSIVGDREQVELSGDINVFQQPDSEGNAPGATGFSLTGNDSHISVDGSININSSLGDNADAQITPISGGVISGEK